MKKLFITIIAVGLCIALFIFLKPDELQPQTQNNSAGDRSLAVEPEIKTFELTVNGGKLTGGPSVLKVTEGDDVVIKITSDGDEEFHLHGYDLSADLEKDTVYELGFTASMSGRFTYELEESHVELGALEVAPK